MGKRGRTRRRSRYMMVSVDVERGLELGGVSSVRAQQSMLQL